MYTIGKQTAKYDGKTNGENFKFELNVTSNFLVPFTIQLFNVLKSVIYDGASQAGVDFKPFDINTVENIVAGTNTVGFITDLNYNALRYQEFFAARNVFVSTPPGQNLTYRDIFSMISAGKCLKMSRISIISDSVDQLKQGTMNVLNVSNLGVITRMSIPLLTFYTPNQDQNNIIDVFVNTELSKNQGLEFTILPGTTTNIQFYLEA
jgi:hypothetical protein